MKRLIHSMALMPLLAMNHNAFVISSDYADDMPRLLRRKRSALTTNAPPADDQPMSRQVRRQMERKQAKATGRVILPPPPTGDT